MSDGEQNKGLVAEARRLARARGLSSITALVDVNRIQISGHTYDVMPADLAALWRADGWDVVRVDGHDVAAIYAAVAAAVADPERPVVILCETVIGKGVSFMEDRPEFHGRALDDDEYARAMGELGLVPHLDEARARRTMPVPPFPAPPAAPVPWILEPAEARTYPPGTKADARGAWGAALVDLARNDPSRPVAVFDCDLAVSVKTDGFAAVRPEGFVECGVGEHNAAAASGACSATGVATFFSDFGVFGVDEVYNQQRLNDINEAGVKLVVTHCGLDVGEDGKTHQCLDYVGAMRDFFGWRVIVPADANQTDRAVRAAASKAGNVCLAMGRSKLPVMVRDDGSPLFAGDYRFEYGRLTRAAQGERGCVLVMGTPSAAALDAVRELAAGGETWSLGVVACPLEIHDEDLDWIAGHDLVVTVEDHGSRSGLGATVAEALSSRGRGPRLVRHGVDRYMPSGAAADLYRMARLDATGIRAVLVEARGAR
jgi:transketolase